MGQHQQLNAAIVGGVVQSGDSINFRRGDTFPGNPVFDASARLTATSNISGGSSTVRNVIGGVEPGAGNLISGNRRSGIRVGEVGQPGGQNRIQVNFIGTDITGMHALPNSTDTPLGAAVVAVGLNNVVGGSERGAGNLISGNRWVGLALGGSGHRVEGNFIGSNASGTHPLGNGTEGVTIIGNQTDITLGGSARGAGNRIAFNGSHGVYLDLPQRISILGNSIWGHPAGYRGIRLLNANNNQAAPELTWADIQGNRLTVAGTLTSAPNTTYTLEFFANPVCHPSGFGEGKQPLGTIQVATNGDGSAAFEAVLHGWLTHPLALGRYITATATDPAGNTSEFSAPAEPNRPLPAAYFARAGEGGNLPSAVDWHLQGSLGSCNEYQWHGGMALIGPMARVCELGWDGGDLSARLSLTS